ncbi:NUDIX domain-containing protein [Oscillibacter sp.]|uniref:NUDIX hydrolase n=1 Tax=Oscillibacter sp. TaxID=1945593 RepID=UPI0028A1A8D3|nr:NUDIX domain-containing protein [Oscillibacter sp.]
MNSDALSQAVEVLRQAEIDGYDGLPEALFLLVSGLVPLPNVDLLVTNEAGQLLLTRRNDGFFQPSWHIPGGCMRYGERFERRVQETAQRELGCKVTMEPEPVAVRNVLRGENPRQPHPRERGHNVALLFRCALPEGFVLQNGDKRPQDNGYARWFDTLPEDFMTIQHVYLDVLRPWIRKEERT